jgi:glycosyltransferase involved in cell wall biosynthesis
MDEHLRCDFYIGDQTFSPIKLMNYKELKGFKKILPFIKLYKNFYWQKGALNLSWKPYKNYIITGEPYCLSTWFVLFSNKLLRKKSFLWTHGWYGDETFVKKIIKKLFFRLSYKVLLYGDYARNLMIKECFNSDKLVCIYNSLDYDTQLKVRANLNYSSIYKDHFKNGYPVILYIGRIQKTKKIDLLIDALHRLNSNGINCNLIIIGEETDDCNLHEAVSNYQLEDNVWFYGPSYDENILGNLVYNASVSVSPGNVGLTAMHCLIYGLPLITHNNFPNQGPEFESIKPGITGDYFIENSAEALYTKIKYWININNDKRNVVRKSCYEEIKGRYNPHKQIDILKKLLNTP